MLPIPLVAGEGRVQGAGMINRTAEDVEELRLDVVRVVNLPESFAFSVHLK